MNQTAEELKREFAEKWSLQWDENKGWLLEEKPMAHILSDLNALLDKLMPTEEEIEKEAYNYSAFPCEDGNVGFDQKEYAIFMDGAKWFRSRMKGGE